MVRSRFDERRELSRAFGLQPLPRGALSQQPRNPVAATLKRDLFGDPVDWPPIFGLPSRTAVSRIEIVEQAGRDSGVRKATVNISADTMGALIPSPGSQSRMSWRDLDNS